MPMQAVGFKLTANCIGGASRQARRIEIVQAQEPFPTQRMRAQVTA